MEPRDPLTDDPFARAAEERDRAAPAPPAAPPPPLARRDPDAPLDESAEFAVARGAASFDVVLGRVQRQGFLAGLAVGALVGASAAAAVAYLTHPSLPDLPLPSRPPMRSAAELGPSGAPAEPPRPGAAHAARARREIARGPGVTRDRAVLAPPDPGAAPAAPAGAAPPEPPAAEPAPAQPGAPRRAAAAAEGAAGVLPPAPAAEPPPAPRRLEEPAVVAAVAARQDALDACFAAGEGDPASPPGRRFRVVLAIDPDGKVSGARIDDAPLAASPLGVCVVRVVRALELPAFDGEPVRVEVPLRIGP